MVASKSWRARPITPRGAGVAPADDASYVALLREQLIVQANLVRRWTATDEKVAADDPVAQAFVRIARKYALPRPWKLSDPVAVEVARRRPSWAGQRSCCAQTAGH